MLVFLILYVFFWMGPGHGSLCQQRLQARAAGTGRPGAKLMAFCESTEGSAKMIEHLEQSKIPKHKEIKEALRHLLTWDLD